MDLITQGLLGATLAQSRADYALRSATVIGLVAGMAPDADVLIRSDNDPLLFLEFHRHFTHALIFVPLGAAVVTLLLWPFFRHRLRVLQIYGFALLGYLLAGFLDACTSYGTYLLWPFSSQPVAWSIVSIIDPLFSVVLLVALWIGWRRRSLWPARVGLLLAGAYLLVAAWQHERVEANAWALAASRGHEPSRLIVKPTIGNIVLWRSLYVSEGNVYADAIRQSLVGASIVYEGESRPLVSLDALNDVQAVLFPPDDLERFGRFSDGWLIQHPDRPTEIGDARFALLPTSLKPIWGIRPSIDSVGVSFVVDRRLTKLERAEFLRMLKGER